MGLRVKLLTLALLMSLMFGEKVSAAKSITDTEFDGYFLLYTMSNGMWDLSDSPNDELSSFSMTSAQLEELESNDRGEVEIPSEFVNGFFAGESFVLEFFLLTKSGLVNMRFTGKMGMDVTITSLGIATEDSPKYKVVNCQPGNRYSCYYRRNENIQHLNKVINMNDMMFLSAKFSDSDRIYKFAVDTKVVRETFTGK